MNDYGGDDPQNLLFRCERRQDGYVKVGQSGSRRDRRLRGPSSFSLVSRKRGCFWHAVA